MYLSKYICPETLKPLYDVIDDKTGELNHLVTKNGIKYEITNGIPDLTYPHILNKADEKARDFYEGRADDYDKYLHLTFKTHNEDEQKARNFFADLLEVNKGDRVLDLACGTGRDSEIIAGRLGDTGEIFCQDISPDMLRRCTDRIECFSLKKHFALSNACYLPFPDNYFDAVYSFGGLGEFSDIKKSITTVSPVISKTKVKSNGHPIFALYPVDHFKIQNHTTPNQWRQ